MKVTPTPVELEVAQHTRGLAHIVAVAGVWTLVTGAGDKPVVVMERCVGTLFAAALANRLPDGLAYKSGVPTRSGLSPPIALVTFGKLVAAVKNCHEKGIAHLNIKLENVGVDPAGEVKLLDFGHAVIAAGPASDPAKLPRVDDLGRLLCRQVPGSFACSSPECIDLFFKSKGAAAPAPAPVDAFKADMWSLGVVLFQLVFGEPPFRTEGSSRGDYFSEPARRALCDGAATMSSAAFWAVQEHRGLLTPEMKTDPAVVQVAELVNVLLLWDPARRPGPAALLSNRIMAAVQRDVKSFEAAPKCLLQGLAARHEALKRQYAFSLKGAVTGVQWLTAHSSGSSKAAVESSVRNLCNLADATVAPAGPSPPPPAATDATGLLRASSGFDQATDDDRLAHTRAAATRRIVAAEAGHAGMYARFGLGAGGAGTLTAASAAASGRPSMVVPPSLHGAAPAAPAPSTDRFPASFCLPAVDFRHSPNMLCSYVLAIGARWALPAILSTLRSHPEWEIVAQLDRHRHNRLTVAVCHAERLAKIGSDSASLGRHVAKHAALQLSVHDVVVPLNQAVLACPRIALPKALHGTAPAAPIADTTVLARDTLDSAPSAVPPALSDAVAHAIASSMGKGATAAAAAAAPAASFPVDPTTPYSIRERVCHVAFTPIGENLAASWLLASALLRRLGSAADHVAAEVARYEQDNGPRVDAKLRTDFVVVDLPRSGPAPASGPTLASGSGSSSSTAQVSGLMLPSGPGSSSSAAQTSGSQQASALTLGSGSAEASERRRSFPTMVRRGAAPQPHGEEWKLYMAGNEALGCGAGWGETPSQSYTQETVLQAPTRCAASELDCALGVSTHRGSKGGAEGLSPVVGDLPAGDGSSG